MPHTAPSTVARPRASSRRQWPAPLWRPTPHGLGALALIVTMALWGMSFVATKPLLASMPPLTLALVRFAVALAVLVPLTWRRGQRPALGGGAAALGLIGMSLFFVCQNLGLRTATATGAAVILNGGIPVLTTMFAALLLREPCRGRHLAGTLVALVGVGGLVATGLTGSIGGAVRGELLLVVAAGCAAAYTLMGRRLFGDSAPLALTTGSMLYGTLFLLPAAATELLLSPLPRPSTEDVVGILYLGVGCTAIPFVLWGYALARLPVIEVAVIGNLELLFGVAFAALLLREVPTPAQVSGGALILLGTWLATQARDDLRPPPSSHSVSSPVEPKPAAFLLLPEVEVAPARSVVG